MDIRIQYSQRVTLLEVNTQFKEGNTKSSSSHLFIFFFFLVFVGKKRCILAKVHVG